MKKETQTKKTTKKKKDETSAKAEEKKIVAKKTSTKKESKKTSSKLSSTKKKAATKKPTKKKTEAVKKTTTKKSVISPIKKESQKKINSSRSTAKKTVQKKATKSEITKKESISQGQSSSISFIVWVKKQDTSTRFILGLVFFIIAIFACFLKYGDVVVTYLFSGLVFFIIFSLIILIHEGGHFWAARMGGIKVEEFGFGLPPKVWGWKNKKSGVEYTINWIPFGGFVRMLGEDDPNNKKAQKNKHSFDNRPLWARIFAVSAGVIMNIILAFVVFWTGFMSGMTPISPFINMDRYGELKEKGYIVEQHDGVLVDEVLKNTNAQKAGFKGGDIITHFNDDRVFNVIQYRQSFEKFLQQRGDGEIPETANFTLLRYGKEIKISLTTSEEDTFGMRINGFPEYKPMYLSVGGAFTESRKEMWAITVGTVEKLGELVYRGVAKQEIPKDVGGPAMIAHQTHKLVEFGDPMLLWRMIGLISLSIGILNIMPFPALDGGRLVFLLIEGVIRKRPSAKLESYIHGIGFAILFTFIIFITFRDIWTINQWQSLWEWMGW